MSPLEELQQRHQQYLTRRHFLKDCSLGLGGVALGMLMGCESTVPFVDDRDMSRPLMTRSPHFAPKAKRVIFLHMAGAPSQLELFDYKPELHQYDGMDCPDEFLEGKRFAFIEGVPKLLGPQTPFQAIWAVGCLWCHPYFLISLTLLMK